MPTANLPPSSGAFGSTRKPPAVPLKFGVNSKARSSSLAKLSQLSQNSSVSLLVAERLRSTWAACPTPSKLTALSVSLGRAPVAPNPGVPIGVALAPPLPSTRVVPTESPIRQ
jgi:hypothetical protein